MPHKIKILGTLTDSSSPAYPVKAISLFVEDSLTLNQLSPYFQTHAINELGYAGAKLDMFETIQINVKPGLSQEQLMILTSSPEFNQMSLRQAFSTGVRNTLISFLEREYELLENHILNSEVESPHELERLNQIMDEIGLISRAFKSQK